MRNKQNICGCILNIAKVNRSEHNFIGKKGHLWKGWQIFLNRLQKKNIQIF